jgi:glycosyltransferase involved in cell wall biosynthesis
MIAQPGLAPRLTVVIPTLNAAKMLPRTVAALFSGAAGWGTGLLRLVVVEGGSQDETTALLAALQSDESVGLDWLTSPVGRGQQLALGAERALAGGADWLMFVHADSLLPPQWGALVADHCAHTPGAAGYFRLAFDLPPGAAERSAARRVEGLANRRARWCGLPYGDQGLLVSAAVYRAAGGYDPALPLMEDVALVRRLRRQGIALRALEGTMLTDPARYQRDGWWWRPIKNLGCLAAYTLGVPVEQIAAWYRR